MKSRLDAAFYALVLVGFASPLLIIPIVNYSMAITSILGELVLAGIFSYAAFWGFSIGKGLALPLYRKQALWVAIAGAYFAGQWLFLALFAPFYPYSGTGLTGLAVDAYYDLGFTVGFMIIFAWIDASIPLLRRSDRFLRDPLSWSRLRYALWSLVLTGAVGTDIVLNAVLAVTHTQYPFLRDLFTTIPYPAILIGAVALGLGINRGNDRTLEKHLKWFGLSAIMIILAFIVADLGHTFGLVSASNALYVQAIDYIFLTLAGVFLFRSARDLVPLSKVSPEVVEDIGASSASARRELSDLHQH